MIYIDADRYSFAEGTTDGPGMFGFLQGTTTDNPFWNKVRDFLSEPTQEEIECQAPKPILLNTGLLKILGENYNRYLISQTMFMFLFR